MIKKDNAIHPSIETIIEQLLLEAQFEYADYKTIDEILDKNSKIKNYISKFGKDENERAKLVKRAKTLTLLLMKNWINKTHRHSAFEEFKDVNDAYLIQLVFLLSVSNSYNIKSIQLNDDKQIIRTIIKITNKVLERTNDNELRILLQDILHAYNNAIKEVSAADTTREDALTYGRDYISFQSEHYNIYVCATVRSIRDLGIPGTWCVSSGTMTKMIGYQQNYAGADGRIFVIIRDKNRKSEKYGLVYNINNNRILSAYDKEDHPVKDRSIFDEVVNVLEEHTDELHALEQRKEYKSLTEEEREYINTNIYAPNAYELFQQRFNNVYVVDLYVVRRNSIDITKIQDQHLLSLPYIKTKYYIKTKQFDKISITSTDDARTLFALYDFNDDEFNRRLWSDEKAVRNIAKALRIKVSAIHNIDGLYYVDVDGDLDLLYLEFPRFPIQFNKVTGRFHCSYNKNLTSLEGAPEYVGGNFNCSYNENLTSLEGAPRRVEGDFNCRSNRKLKFISLKLISPKSAPEYVGGDFNCIYNGNLASLEGAPEYVGGNFNCSYSEKLTSLKGAPEYVGGNFNCSYNENLTSLEGAPRRVEGDFICDHCNLTSLEGAPEYVGGDFNCEDNKNLTSLEGAPRRVEGNFLCYKCNLTSLESAPEYVGGGFDCGFNKNLTSLKGAPRRIEGYFNCSYNEKLTSLEGVPRRIEGSFWCAFCNLTSLEGAPEYVGGDFSCVYNENLPSLKGAPRRVEGKFLCHDCNLTSLEGAPEYVGGDFGCGHNENLASLKGAPRRVEGDFWCSHCNLTSLEGAPEYVGSNFDCRDNKNLHPSWIEWLKQHSEIKGKIIYTNIGNENSPNPAPGFTHDTINNDVTDVVEQVVMRILKNKE